ncbi:MAG: ATP-binding protein [Verrucomicrobiales bacterium]|nr:ATP-binding protein [Verrucomicrobiales bacterium]
MRSLRTRLVLISTLVSGAVIIGVSLFAWHYVVESARDGIDLRLEGITGRIIRDMHPRMDPDLMRERINITHGDDVSELKLHLLLRDDINDSVVFSSLESIPDFFQSFPEGFPQKPDVEAKTGNEVPGAGRGEDGFGRRPPPHHEGKEKRPPPRGGAVPGSGDSFEARGGIPGKGAMDQQYATVSALGKDWRVMISHERGYFVLAAVDLTGEISQLRKLERVFIVGIPLAIALIGLGGWIVVDRAMKPVRKIAEAASAVTAHDLSARIEGSHNSDPEFEHLIGVLNGMMDRLETGFSHANRFSADVSHELKTPITVMQGEIESALRDCEPGTAQENQLLVLRGETDRLKSIIRSLMLLSQADVGELIRKCDPIELSEELQNLVEDAEILAEDSGLVIQSSLDEGVVMEGDATLMRQALLNLINNAIKYNELNGYVSITLRGGDGIRLEFENSGSGIPAEDRERVFDRFYRADQSRSRQVDGFGLGLSLTRAIVEGHGGRIWLEEVSGEATRFVINLPPQASRS